MVDDSGRIDSVTERRHPERPYLAGVELEPPTVNGAVGSWLDRVVEVDDDEIDITMRLGDMLSVNLRHSLSTGWATRLLIVNTGDQLLVVDRLPLAVRPAVGNRICAVAAGSRMCWAMQPADGHGSLLVARLATGSIARIDVEHLEFGGLRLVPGQRYVAQLRWELLPTPRSVVGGPGRDVLVSRTTYEVDEPALLPDDPDAALVLPPDVAVDTVETADFVGREIFATSPGRHRVELRSAEGDVQLELSWVRSLASQLQTWAGAILTRPQTSAGVVSVEDLPSAIVLQAALGASGLVDAESATDALDLLTARLLDESGSGRSGSPLSVLYLLGEHGRTGDPDVFDAGLVRAESLVAQTGGPTPGLGLAVLRLVLATASSIVETSSASRVSRIVAQCVGRAVRQADLDAEAPNDGMTRTVRQAAELELLLAVQPLLPPGSADDRRMSDLVRALGAALGAGLPGRLLSPPSTAEHAYLVTVLRMLPEDSFPEVTRTWGAAPVSLVRRATLEVLDRLTLPVVAGVDPASSGAEKAAQADLAAAWLALAQRQD